MLGAMRGIWVLFVLITAATASAQPVSYAFKGDVPVGEKPQVRITAAEPVTDVKIALERSDGKVLTLKAGALAKGKSVTRRRERATSRDRRTRPLRGRSRSGRQRHPELAWGVS